jgi:hypothetical protein
MLPKKHRKRSIACLIGMSPLHTYLYVFNFWFKFAEICVSECRRLTISTNAQDFFLSEGFKATPYINPDTGNQRLFVSLTYVELADLVIRRVGDPPYHQYAEYSRFSVSPIRRAANSDTQGR